jgi:multidrug efflux system outer membrane protein
MFSVKKLLCILSSFIFLSGCRVGPKYQPPAVDSPDSWKESQITCCDQVFEGMWWEVFQDENLNWLEQQAILNNPNLYAALDRVAQARAIVGVDRAALYPHVTLDPSYTNTGQLFKIFLPNGGTFLPANFPTIFRIHQLQYVMPFNMSYEMDLWGKLHGQYDSAVYNAQAQEENLQSALLTLTTELASDYFLLRATDRLIEVQQKNLELLAKNVQLVQTRFTKGLVSEVDALSAKQQLTDNEATYYDTIRQRALLEHAIGALIGMTASNFFLESIPLIDPPPQVQACMPSKILLQRPDLRAAERTMASQHALISVAYASFFPSVELTGTLGFLSPDIRQFMRWKSRLWQIGLNASMPIFDAGYNEANLKLSYAEFNESLHNYQEKVLTAFHEVEDSLANLEWQYKEWDKYEESSMYATKRMQLTTNRYKSGLSNYLDVIDSERTKIQTDINRLNALGQRYLSTIQLIKALGGSWSFSLQSSLEEPTTGDLEMKEFETRDRVKNLQKDSQCLDEKDG